METATSEIDAYRQAFKRFNHFMIWMWRLGFRRWINIWPRVTGRIMVLTHIGRKSGLQRLTPVNYAPVDGHLYCTAAFGGGADWYRNILADPRVEVWLPDSWWAGTAEDISDCEDRLPLLRQVLIASGFAAPMFGVNPRALNEQELAEVTEEYRLVRVRLVERLHGAGGPGDLAWVWVPVSLALALIILLIRSMNRNALK